MVMGLKPRTTRMPKFSGGDHKVANDLCDYWREVVRRRDVLVDSVERSKGGKEPSTRSKRRLEELDAALGEVRIRNKKNLDRVLKRNEAWATSVVVGLVEDLLRDVGPRPTAGAEGMAVVAESCGVLPGDLQHAILDREVQDLLPSRGTSMRKAALEVVGILRAVSASTVNRERAESQPRDRF